MRTRSQKTLWTSVAVAAVFAICAVPASAQVGTGFVEFYGGITFIGGDVDLPCGGNIVCVPEGAEVNIADVKSDFDDDTPMFGIGLGYRRSDKFGIVGTLTWVDGDDTFGAPFEGSPLELDIFFFDLSFQFFPGGKNFYFLVGPGFADIEASTTVQAVGIPELPSVTVDLSASETTFTAHVGAGREFNFGERTFFRGQSKVRWIDSDVYDDLDIEASVGIGIRWGG